MRCVTEFRGGKNVKVYFAFYGSRKSRISKTQFERHLAMSMAGVDLERRQGGKRGNGVVPAAGHCWPLKCEALAVHPKRVTEMNARNKARGINVTYEPEHGLAIVPDAGAYKRLLKDRGVHHNNCYN